MAEDKNPNFPTEKQAFGRKDGWLTKDGELIVMPGYSHAVMAINRGLIDIKNLPENIEDLNADTIIEDLALEAGHVRFIYEGNKLNLNAERLDSNTKDVLRKAFSEGLFPEGRVWIVWGRGNSGRDRSFDSMEDARDWLDHIVTGAAKKAEISPAHKRINFQGIPIQIEWPRGSTRHGINPDGTTWSNLMYADYGFILPTKRNVPVIEEFLKHYEREIDYYEEAAEITKEKLEEALQAIGIRAQVTFRAKSPKRLRKKLYRRMPTKHYKTFRDIYNDIIDLSGTRVALYLPADREVVGRIIEQLFEEARPVKHFPEDNGPGDENGYIADHYLVRLKPETLDGADRRYAETKVEIQVASVLMHAYAEISHDLIYKPEKGNLSPDEKLLLSQLNEIVRGGEVALERLQEKIEDRTDEDLRFELVGSCVKKASVAMTAAGWTTDGEPADVYVGEDYDSPYVYAVEQLKPDGEFDEFKFMLGFSTLEQAHEVYLKHFQDTAHPREIEGIYEIPMEEFRAMVGQHGK
jgi:ppGpp synthetase/RelA/SpoT-type nucleotidyltranferase